MTNLFANSSIHDSNPRDGRHPKIRTGQWRFADGLAPAPMLSFPAFAAADETPLLIALLRVVRSVSEKYA
jgi:hypothetical protein